MFASKTFLGLDFFTAVNRNVWQGGGHSGGGDIWKPSKTNSDVFTRELFVEFETGPTIPM